MLPWWRRCYPDIALDSSECLPIANPPKLHISAFIAILGLHLLRWTLTASIDCRQHAVHCRKYFNIQSWVRYHCPNLALMHSYTWCKKYESMKSLENLACCNEMSFHGKHNVNACALLTSFVTGRRMGDTLSLENVDTSLLSGSGIFRWLQVPLLSFLVFLVQVPSFPGH